jgi:hypothetical protein
MNQQVVSQKSTEKCTSQTQSWGHMKGALKTVYSGESLN